MCDRGAAEPCGDQGGDRQQQGEQRVGQQDDGDGGHDGSLLATFGRRRAARVDQGPQMLEVFGGKAVGFEEMREQGGEGAAGEFVGKGFEAALEEVFAGDSRRKRVRRADGLAGDASLGFETFEQLLDGGIVRRAAAGIEMIGKLADGGGRREPEAFKHGKFRRSDIGRVHVSSSDDVSD